jgi:hypothetical protein
VILNLTIAIPTQRRPLVPEKHSKSLELDATSWVFEVGHTID